MPIRRKSDLHANIKVFQLIINYFVEFLIKFRKTEDKLQLAESELAKKDADIASLRREVADTKAFSQKLENSKVT